jgi:hypothetical protein
MLNVDMLSDLMLSVIMLNVDMLSDLMLSVIMLNVDMPSVVMLSVISSNCSSLAHYANTGYAECCGMPSLTRKCKPWLLVYTSVNELAYCAQTHITIFCSSGLRVVLTINLGSSGQSI